MCPKRVRPNRTGFPVAAPVGEQQQQHYTTLHRTAKPTPPMSGVTLVYLAVLSGLLATSHAASSPNYNELGSDGGYKVFALEAEQDRGKFDCLWDSVASPSRTPVLARAIFIGNKNPLIGIAIPVLNGTYYAKEEVIDPVKFPDVSEYWANFFNISPENLTWGHIIDFEAVAHDAKNRSIVVEFESREDYELACGVGGIDRSQLSNHSTLLEGCYRDMVYWNRMRYDNASRICRKQSRVGLVNLARFVTTYTGRCPTQPRCINLPNPPPDTPIGLKHNQSYHYYNQLEATEPVDTCVVDQLICPVSGPEGTGWEGMNFFAFPNVQALMLAIQQLDGDPTRQNQNEWIPKGFTGGQMRYMGAAIISRYHADNLTPPLVCSARVGVFHNNSLEGLNYKQFFVDLRVHGASAPIPSGWSLELRGIDPNSRVTSLEGYGGTSASTSNGTWTLSITPSVSLDEEDSLCEGHNQLLQGGVNLTSSCDTLHEPEWAILHTSEGSMHCYVESFQPSMSAWPDQCDDLLP
ncbi:hypothetical protein QOT17_018283 [Balamuthia mandrillaris]